MSKAKYIASAGIIAAGAALSGLPQENKAHAESTDSTKKEIIISAPASDEHTASLNADTSSRRTITCRTAQKVYHRFEEIPEISDSEAIAYNRDDYTYIINADQYQKTGKIEYEIYGIYNIYSGELKEVRIACLIRNLLEYETEDYYYDFSSSDEDSITYRKSYI